MDFIVGGIAGAGATLFTNPMDVVKTRLQLQGELKAHNQHRALYKNIFHAIYVIGKTDGILALQKGLAPALVLGFAMNSVRLGLYHVSEVHGWTKSKTGEVSIPKSMFWSCISGFISGVVANPVSVVKTRIQASAHPSIAVGRQHRYKGMLDAFSKISKMEGLKGFFAGVNATCMRLAIGSAAQLTTYSTSKEVLLSHGICERSPLGLAFLASMISGAFVVLSICPFDVATVRLYNQGCPNAERKLLYAGVIDCLKKIHKTEGLRGLYKGVGPLYLRIAPHTTISLVIWDVLNDVIAKNKL